MELFNTIGQKYGASGAVKDTTSETAADTRGFSAIAGYLEKNADRLNQNAALRAQSQSSSRGMAEQSLKMRDLGAAAPVKAPVFGTLPDWHQHMMQKTHKAAGELMQGAQAAAQEQKKNDARLMLQLRAGVLDDSARDQAGTAVSWSTEPDYAEYVQKGRGLQNPTVQALSQEKRYEPSAKGFWEAGKDFFQNTVGKIPSALKDANAWAVHTIPGYGPITGQGMDAEYATPQVQNKVTFSREIDQKNNGAFDVTSAFDVAGGAYHRLYSYMTEGEVDDYSYLLARYGEEKADAYLERLMPTLQQRELAPVKKHAEEHPGLAVANSFGNQLLSVVGFVDDTAKVLTGQKLDPYNTAHRFANQANTERGTIMEGIDSNAGKAAFSIATSLGDMAIAMAAGSMLGTAFGTGTATGSGSLATLPSGTVGAVQSTIAANQPTILGIMGSQAAANTVIGAKERGLSDSEAYMLGVLSGAAEVLTESIGIEALLGDPKNAIAYVLKNTAAEGAEEGLASIFNLLADVIVAGDKSEWNASMQMYRAAGKSLKDAFLLTLQDRLKTINQDIIAGMASGFFLGSATSTFDSIQSARAKKETFSKKLAESGVDADKIDQLASVMEKATRKRLSANEQALMQSNPQAQAILLQAMQGRTVLQPTVEATQRNADNNDWVQSFYEDTSAERAAAPMAENVAADEGALWLPAVADNAPASQSADLQLTANDTRQDRGGMNDGTEQQTDALPYASQERHDGVGAGGQAGSVASHAESRTAALERARTAIERENRANDLRLAKVSTYDLGIHDGTTEAVVTVMPQDAWDSGMQETARRIKAESGVDVRYVIGKMQIETASGMRFVNGAIVGNTAYVQANHRRYGIDSVADHEQYHAFAARDSALVRETVEQIRANFTAEEFDAIFAMYQEAYRGVYEEGDAAIMEEILADAYAGVNSFGGDVTAYSETVRGIVEERHGKSAEPVRDGDGRAPPMERSARHSREINPYTGRSLAEDGEIYNYDFLVSLPEMKVTVLPDIKDIIGNEKRINREKVIDLGIKNARSVGTERDGKIFVENRYTNRPLQITTTCIRHGLDGEKYRLFSNSRLGAMVGEVVKNAVPINALKNKSDGVTGTYAMAVYAVDKTNREYVAIITVEQRENAVSDFEIYDITHSINGRTKKGSRADSKSQGFDPSTATTISIAELLDIVKETHQSVLSENVLEHFGEKRNQDGYYFSQAKFSLEPSKGLSEERRRETEQAFMDSIWGEGFDFEAATAPSKKGVIPEGMTIDEYEAMSREQARAEKEERIRMIPKSEFQGSAAMEKLGIRVEGTVASYENDRAGYLLAEDRAAKSLRRELSKAEQRLQATDRQKMLANAIVAGTMTETDLYFLPGEDVEKIMELADYYTAVNSLGESRLRHQKRQINSKLDEKAEVLFADSDRYEPSSMLVMNYRTPQRNMLRIFGEEQGQKIYEEYFAPVVVNEAERYRFLNRMHDEVRKFEGRDGKAQELNREERAAVQMVIEGRAVAEQVAGMEIRAMIEGAAQNIQNGMDVADAAMEFRLTEPEKALAQRYAKWLQNKAILESPKVDTVRVENAVVKYQDMFNRFYDAINDFLVVHGYEPIGFIKGYVPHLQPENVQGTFSRVMESLGVGEKVSSIPTSIAGQTADFKPGKRWDPYFQTRTGETTDYDVATAYESYVEYLSDIFYHTDDIMRLRRAAAYFRRTYSPAEIRNNIEWAEGLRNASTERKIAALREAGKIGAGTAPSAEDVSRMMDEYVDELYENIGKTTKYNNFVMWLDNYANILAGKQSMADRGWEYLFGREVLNMGNKLTAAFGRAQVGGNLSSALNQSAQLPMIIAECGERNVWRAVRDIVKGEVRRAGFVESSDFLTGKKGVKGLTSTAFDSIVEGTFKPLEVMDSTLSTIAARAAWHKAISEGKSAEAAMKAADRYAAQVMGSRMKGEKPLSFHAKNPLANMVNIFQVEALNYAEHLTQDVPREIRDIAQSKGKKAAAAALATVLVKCLIASFVLNRASEELYGGTPAPFDLAGLSMNFFASGEGLTTNEWIRTIIDNGWEKITGERLFDTEGFDDEHAFDWGSAAEDTAYNITNDIPFVRNVSAVMGWGDNSLPLPDVYGGVEGIVDSIKDDGVFSWDTAESIGELLAQILPGGRQLTKTAQGIKTMAQGGSYKGYGDDRKLQYPVKGTPDEWIAAALFGKAALNENDEFYASGKTLLSEKQTDVYDAMVDGGADRIETYDTIQAVRAAKDARAKRAALAQADLTDRQKAQLYSGIISDSRDEEFDAMLGAGLTWQEITDAYDRYAELSEEEGKTASSKAAEFAMWVDKNGWTDEQGNLVKESFKFYSHVPAEAGKYEALADAGVSSETAYRVTEELAALEPEDGKSSVTSVQRYKAIVGMDLSESEKQAALASYMGDSVRRKMEVVCDYGVTATQYVGYITAADANGNGNTSQEEAKEHIDAIKGLTTKQRAALWQAANKSWKAEKNPYSERVGAAVREALNAETSEDAFDDLW